MSNTSTQKPKEKKLEPKIVLVTQIPSPKSFNKKINDSAFQRLFGEESRCNPDSCAPDSSDDGSCGPDYPPVKP